MGAEVIASCSSDYEEFGSFFTRRNRFFLGIGDFRLVVLASLLTVCSIALTMASISLLDSSVETNSLDLYTPHLRAILSLEESAHRTLRRL